MASGQERVLRRRIRSVQSTKKITRAMELIAASRIVKAQQRVAAARPYSEQITEVIRNLASTGAGKDHPLLRPRDEISTVGFVVVTADRAVRHERDQGRWYSLVLAGRKAESYFRFRGYQIDHAASGFSEQPTYDDAKAVADAVIERYEESDVDQVQLVFTRFLSVGSQRVVNRRLLPLETEALVEARGEGPQADYEYEPDPEEILERLGPRDV